jgi:hypothetical protein
VASLIGGDSGRLETCTHLSESLGPAVTALFQTMSYGKTPEDWVSLDIQRNAGEPCSGCWV